RRAFGRAADYDGRTVPNTALAHAHFEAPRTFLALYRRYRRDPKVSFWVLQNTGLEKDIAERNIDYLREVANNRRQGEDGKRDARQEINRGIEDEYRDRVARGRVPEDYIYRASQEESLHEFGRRVAEAAAEALREIAREAEAKKKALGPLPGEDQKN